MATVPAIVVEAGTGTGPNVPGGDNPGGWALVVPEPPATVLRTPDLALLGDLDLLGSWQRVASWPSCCSRTSSTPWTRSSGSARRPGCSTSAATPALVVVGFLLMTQVRTLDWTDYGVAIPGLSDDRADAVHV